MVDEIKEDVYTSEGRKEELDSDAIDVSEEGIMEGYESKDEVECANCHQVLVDDENVVELKIGDKDFKFCCNECAEEFKRKHKEA